SAVLLKLQQGGVQLAGLHNHLLMENPRVMYLHIGGVGDPVKMAGAIHDALSLSKTPLTPPSSPPASSTFDLDAAQLDQILGQKGTVSNGVYKVSVPRPEKITD